MPVIWTITAQGEALRTLEDHAAALGVRDPDLEWPDPVALFAQFVDLGFAVPQGGPVPRFELIDTRAEPAADRHRWTARVDGLHSGYARVIENLLRAPGTGEVSIDTAYEPGGEGHRVDTRSSYPPPPSERRFELDYRRPDPSVMQRDRHVALNFHSPMTAALRETVCADLQVWIEAVWRSGFAPQGEHPSQCGAIPTVAYAYDAHAVAIDFEQVFRVDEACFASLLAYANRLVDGGQGVASLLIA